MMEIRVLRYFLTVVREETISRAAEVLHITQPTLSRQLTQLEEELGVTLFHRGSRKITLTNEGMLLRRRAEEVLDLIDKTSQELLVSEEISGTITIGAGELASVQTMVELCGSFQEKYPRVKFDLYTATADQVKERMERGLVDIGLLLEPVDMERYEFVRLGRKENWVVLMRPDSPLAGKESITPQDLAGLALLMPSRLSVQSEVANWFGDAFERLDIRYTGNLSTNSAVVVQKGYGYAVVIEGTVTFWNPELIVAKPLSPPLTATTVFAWRRNQPFSKATEKFIEHIRTTLLQQKDRTE
jgi:DNA-binding transcriptional LysR family regulator